MKKDPDSKKKKYSESSGKESGKEIVLCTGQVEKSVKPVLSGLIN